MTGATEDNVRTLATNWTGDATISGTGDSEQASFTSGQYLESEIVNTGATTVLLAINQYEAGDSVTIKYKTAATSGGIAGETWQDYSATFVSAGFVQIRLEVA